VGRVDFASLSENLTPGRGINRREIDSQRRRSIQSGRADKKQQKHSAERYSKRMNWSKSKESGLGQIRELMWEKSASSFEIISK
jgi:hypothetical protein